MRVFLFALLMYLNNHLVNRIPLHSVRLLWYRRVMRFDIGKNTYIHLGVTFDTWKNLHLGRDSVINARCRIDNRAPVTIGSSVSISQEVILLTGDHDLFDTEFSGSVRPTTVEDFVFVGTRAVLLPGLTLEEGCAVGVASVVTRSVARRSIVAGAPARSLARQRPDMLDYKAGYAPLFQ